MAQGIGSGGCLRSVKLAPWGDLSCFVEKTEWVGQNIEERFFNKIALLADCFGFGLLTPCPGATLAMHENQYGFMSWMFLVMGLIESVINIRLNTCGP